MSHGGDDAFYRDMGVEVVDHLGGLQGHPRLPRDRLVRLLVAAGGEPELPGRCARTKRACSASSWALDPQPRTRATPARHSSRPDAALDLDAFELRWFDHWLKGVDNGVDREPPVRIYVMGGGDAHKTPEGRVFVGGHWRDETGVAARTDDVHAVLPARGRGARAPTSPAAARPHHLPLRSARTRCRLSAATSPRRGRSRVPGPPISAAGRISGPATDAAPLSTRNDILVFATAPLDAGPRGHRSASW